MTEITTRDLCTELGVSPVTVHKYIQQGLGDAAKLGRNRWDRDKALTWWNERHSLTLATTGRDYTEPLSAADLLAARVELIKLQSEGQRSRNSILAGKSFLWEDVEPILTELAAQSVATVDAWVRRGRTAVEIETRKTLANELRNELADSLEAVASRLKSGKDLAPTRLRVS